MSDQACWNFDSFLNPHSFVHNAKSKVLFFLGNFFIKQGYQIVLFPILPFKIDVNSNHLLDIKMYIDKQYSKVLVRIWSMKGGVFVIAFFR